MKLKDKIIKLREEGLKYDEIKEKLNCSKSTISYHCNNEGFGENYLEYKDFKIKTNDVDQVVSLRKDGKGYDDIKIITELSIDKIKLICRKNHLTSPKGFHKSLAESMKKEMQEYYDDCGSSYKVADKFGFNRQTVCKYIITKRKSKMSDEDRKKSKSKNVVNWRRRKKLDLIEYKGGGCEICRYNKSVRSLSFHHKDPMEKDFNVSAKGYSYERLKKEVDKCVLVCSNCHSEIHDEIEEKGYSEIVNNLYIPQ